MDFLLASIRRTYVICFIRHLVHVCVNVGVHHNLRKLLNLPKQFGLGKSHVGDAFFYASSIQP